MNILYVTPLLIVIACMVFIAARRLRTSSSRQRILYSALLAVLPATLAALFLRFIYVTDYDDVNLISNLSAVATMAFAGTAFLAGLIAFIIDLIAISDKSDPDKK